MRKTLQLDGSASTGIKGSALTYLWSLESKPALSTVQLLDTMNPWAQVWPDVAGVYKFKLVVSSGGKSSAPVIVSVEAVAAGALPPFATFKASGLSISDSGGATGCSYFRSPANFATFWSFMPNPLDLNCTYPQPNTFPDVKAQGGFGGGQPSMLGSSLEFLDGSGVSGAPQVTWANVNTLSSYGYGISAEAASLANIPAGTATGTLFVHSIAAAYAMPHTTGVVPFKIEGTVQPINVPAGWQVVPELLVRVTLEGATFENGQPGSSTTVIFERAFTADFVETIPLNLNWAQLPVAYAGGSATYRMVVSHRMTFKRTAE